MEYLTDEQMKFEKPIKKAYTKDNNAMEKFLHQSGNNSFVTKALPGASKNVYYSPRNNKVVVLG